MLGLVLSGSGIAAPPSAQSPAPATPPARPAVPPPDDSLLEFLGSDDVGAARWWENMRKSGAVPASPPPAQQTPAQEAGK